MRRTKNLGLPIYDNPSVDLFKISDFNDAHEKIDKQYEELQEHIKHEIGSVDLSGYATKEHVTEQIDKNKINPNFKIGTVTTLDAGQNATVTIRGTYPNLILDFAIPRGANGGGGGSSTPTDPPTPEEPPTQVTEKMYYGRLSIQEVGGSVIQFSNITESMIKNAKGLTIVEPSTLGKTSLGSANATAEGDYQIVIVPSSKSYTVTKDNGFGGKVAFDEETSGANGLSITIDGIAYKIYGEILLSQGEMFIYVD